MDIGPVPPDTARADAAAGAGSNLEETWLLGQPPLRDYLDFVRDMAVDAPDQRALCDEWRRANDYYHDLEVAEAGIADAVERRDLDPALAALAEALVADPHFRNTFDLLPAAVELVELDRLVVWQPRVTATFVNALQARLGPAPDAEALFRFCLPIRPAKIRSVASPRILGPTAVRTTLTTVSARTVYVLARSGRRRASSRLSEGQKVSAFWPIIPPPIGPRPGPGPDWMRSVSLRVPGLGWVSLAVSVLMPLPLP